MSKNSIKISKVDRLDINMSIDDLEMDEVEGTNNEDFKIGTTFKPSMIDTKLGKFIYFKKNIELSEKNLSDAGFDNNIKTHREVLTNRRKMQDFVGFMKKKKNKADAATDAPTDKATDEANLKFIKKIFFKDNEKINISPNTFIIYSSDWKTTGIIDNPTTTRFNDTFVDNLYRADIKVKLIDSKDKLSTLDRQKIKCSDRAKIIESDILDLFGIELDLFKSANMYNPFSVYEKIQKEDKVSERKKIRKKYELERLKRMQTEGETRAATAAALAKKDAAEAKKVQKDMQEDIEDGVIINGGAYYSRRKKTKKKKNKKAKSKKKKTKKKK